MKKALSRSRLLHLDPGLCIVDKPAGVLSLDAPGSRPSLIPLVAGLLRSLGEKAALFPVHRLDLETTGALVLARSPECRRSLEDLFREHRLERVYHALVLGAPHPRRGTLVHHLLEGPEGRVRAVSSGGQRAVTRYATLASLEGFSVLACGLETGRRNQIRVQLAERGHPLLGDRKYGGRRLKASGIQAPRTMLHATGLSFLHPETGEGLSVLAPFPGDFTEFLGAGLSRRLQSWNGTS